MGVANENLRINHDKVTNLLCFILWILLKFVIVDNGRTFLIPNIFFVITASISQYTPYLTWPGLKHKCL